MAKLNKQEINAIANKTLRMINQKRDENLQKAVNTYHLSKDYKLVKESLYKIVELEQKRDEISKEIQTLLNKVTVITDECDGDVRNPRYYTFNTIKIADDLVNELIHWELSKSFTKVTIEEIKEDITIASIDESFCVDDFINNLIKQYSYEV